MIFLLNNITINQISWRRGVCPRWPVTEGLRTFPRLLRKLARALGLLEQDGSRAAKGMEEAGVNMAGLATIGLANSELRHGKVLDNICALIHFFGKDGSSGQRIFFILF